MNTPRARCSARPLSFGLAAATALALLSLLPGCTGFGKAAQGQRLVQMEQSKQRKDGVFVNEQPMFTSPWSSIGRMLFGSDVSSPEQTIVPYSNAKHDLHLAADERLKVTWLGHSTVLIQVDGKTYLTDPVWGPRSSPYSWIGPKRWYPPPLSLDDLPKLDAVLISHDHYDHLDYPTIVQLKDRDTRFIMPLGVGAHLEYWGVAADRITELDWWNEISIDGQRLVLVPARHASGRHLFDQNSTLWGGFVILGDEHRLYFSGDTGFFPGLRDIGQRFGPFDVTMIEVGAYDRTWPDWHMGPEQAVLAHRIVGGKVFLPIHWGLFNLALHAWTAPIERVMTISEKLGVQVASPRPGQSFNSHNAHQTIRWWPDVPYQDATKDAVIATKNGKENERFKQKDLEQWLFVAPVLAPH